MKIIKWKLKIKNIDDIKRILIFSINRNSLINIVKEETDIFFYSIVGQDKILIQIDDIYADLDIIDSKDNKFEFKSNNVIRAILFYSQIKSYKYINDKQNIIDDRYIYSRSYKSLVPEYLNKSYFIIIRDILNNKKYGSNYMASLITTIFAYYINSNLSSMLIKPFIREYSIDESKYIVRGPSFNAFFIRELKVPLKVIKNTETIYSPVSARVMLYNYKNLYKLKLHIKGKNFSLLKLINEKKIEKKYSVAVCRLAINDYHHVHMPEDGILIKISEFNGTYTSVDIDYLRNSEYNVLNDNKRVVLKFKRSDDSRFYIILIGSILISSIVHKLELNKTYYTREKICYFQYGGSCVVYVSDRNIYFDSDLLYFSNECIESHVKVGEEIGNVYKQKEKLFINSYNIKKHIFGFINKLINYIVLLIIKINKKYLKDLNLQII
jgi:phosphatidylserine decarboxylase precursor